VIQAMLLFSLGPVQSFIAQARKTRDLWLGSYLLSLLMEASMENIAALIFPATPSVQGTIADLPNKYIALFPDIVSAQAAAELSERQLKQRWLHICQDVWHRVLAQHSTAATRAIWERQTNPEHIFEIFWVIVEGDEQHYPEWLRHTQEALAARKRLRTVRWRETSSDEQWNEPGEKSTISGEREALRNEDDTRQGVRAFWQEIAARFPRDLSQNGEERLDAIDTVKRFAFLSDAGRNTRSFPSTTSIATAPFVQKLLTTDLDAIVIKEWLDSTQYPLAAMERDTIPYLARLAGNDAYRQAALQRDGDCYFLETHTPQRLKRDYGITSAHEAESRAESGRIALNRLLREADAHLIPRPTPYYALFQMDGDRIGRLLGGVENRQEHSTISAALSIFSRQRAAAIVQESYPGRLIYAGGDDALALAPLYSSDSTGTPPAAEPTGQTIFSLVEHLQAEYCATIKKAIGSAERKREVSTSAGIAIAHHSTSLSYVRRVVSAAEQSAKKEYGRNALVVIVLRRSGEQTKVGCHWQYNVWSQGEMLTIRPLVLFNEFYRLFKRGALSPHSVYALLQEAPTLVMLEQDVQRSEIARVLRRQRISTRELPAHWIETLAQRLVELATAMDEGQAVKGMERAVELHAPGPRYGLVEVLGWLLVMNFIARRERG
jgi:CRISPR-associated protein Cmr2